MGEQLIYSTKTRRDLEEFGWHRFTNNDEGLPDWFVDDEKRHYRKQLPVTKAQMDEYRQRQREFNARPIKKVAEAKMRKRKKEMSKLRLAKKRAQRIVDDPEMEQHEKVREMKKVYQKAATKKPDVSYKVISKGKRGTGARPKGPFKVVDKRLKKDNRKDKEETRKSLWKKKSPEAKRAAMEKNKRSRTGRKADKRTKRRAKRGKTN
uniref:Ribosomal RNA methyltransferase SPB1-like C-terminal domain-containing protein n=1 Tax=Plectus sambesii TaxID=2011161 RepID=A0A914X7J0_9BILA